MPCRLRDEARVWSCRERRLALRTPLVMGILNVTPDSFSDGGRYVDLQAAVDRAHEMADQGADIIDVGGESTRPGSEEVSVECELERVIPVITRIAGELELPVSIDTRHAVVARAALDAGADIINNVMPLSADEKIARFAADSGAGLVLMHMRGSPQTMSALTSYDDVVEDVFGMLRENIDFAFKHGVACAQIVVDPGIGFAKDTSHNLKLIAGLERLSELAPVLAGSSRKRFIAELCNEPDAAKRTGGSVGAAVMSVLHGAAVVRVHDVRESVQALTVVNAVREFERSD